MKSSQELAEINQIIRDKKISQRFERICQAIATQEDPTWLSYADVLTVVTFLFRDNLIPIDEQKLRTTSKEALTFLAHEVLSNGNLGLRETINIFEQIHHNFKVQQLIDLVETKRTPEYNTYQLRREALQRVVQQELGIKTQLPKNEIVKELLSNENWQIFRFIVIFTRQLNKIQNLDLSEKCIKEAKKDGTFGVLHIIVSNAQEHIIRNIARFDCVDPAVQQLIVSRYIYEYETIKFNSDAVDYSQVDLSLINAPA